MSLQIWVAYAAACAIVLVVPGPTILTVIGYSLSQQHRERRMLVPALVAGVTLGDSTALVLSLLGLGAVLAASAFAFTLVKWIGGLYLIALGVKTLRSGVRLDLDRPAPQVATARLFLNTYAVTALNPKGIIFFVAFLPAFVRQDGNVGLQLWILALTFVVLATINATLYALFAGSARRLLRSANAQRWFNGVGGSLLVSAGLWALLARRAPLAG